MTSSPATRRLDWRAYFMRPHGELQRIARHSWRALKGRTSQRADLANQHTCVVYAFLLVAGRRPIVLLSLEGIVWRFDDAGLIDYRVPTFDDRRLGLQSRFAADILPQEAHITGDRWLPTSAVRRAVERDIWPAGPPSLGFDTVTNAPGERADLKRALAAVGAAGMTRTLSRIVGELSLSQSATKDLMAALAVEPQLLRDMILAETEYDDQLAH